MGLVSAVLKNQIQGGHEEQGDEGGEGDAPCEGDRHRDQELGLPALFEKQRSEADHRRE